MSHFCTLVLVEPDIQEGQVLPRVTDLLGPYDENKEVAAYVERIDAEVAASMASRYMIDTSEEDYLQRLVPFMRNWNNHAGYIDEDGLYYMSTRNPDSHWDWWVVGGRWSNYLGRDDLDFASDIATLTPDLVEHVVKDPPFAIVTSEDGWIGRGRMGWFGIAADEEEQDTWIEKVQAVLNRHVGYAVVVCDLHI